VCTAVHRGPERSRRQQQQNILNAIADGGESRSLRVKLKEIEGQQAEVADRLRRLTGLLGLQRQDLARLEATALLKLKDWTGLIHKHPLQARAIVKKFVPGRFVFTPVLGGSGTRPRYEVTATANATLILGAVVPALLPPATGPRAPGIGASHVGGDPGGIRSFVDAPSPRGACRRVAY
jgi:hypothetical protein